MLFTIIYSLNDSACTKLLTYICGRLSHKDVSSVPFVKTYTMYMIVGLVIKLQLLK
jgi:hypothetical protein